jgi:phosphonate transport system substrate-binding protein
MVRQLRPIVQWIAAETGKILGEKLNIRIQVVRGYKQGVALITDGRVDFTRLGPASYVTAKKVNPSLSIIAMEKKNGRKMFHGIIAVHQDSNFKSIEDLRGTVFGFGNKRSTLGRYFAQLYLTDAGIRADDLKSYKYLGRHDKVGRAVGSQLVDAGALEETTFYKLVNSGVPIRAIAKMSNATRPWVARAGLNKRVFNALRQAMLTLDDPEIAKKFRFQGFLVGSDADYKATRRAIQENYRFFVAKG